MPFRDPNGGDLFTRIESELRERIEEALDAACLDTMVKARQAQGMPAPVPDSDGDRAEYHVAVRELLDRLQQHFAESLSRDLRQRLEARLQAAARSPSDPVATMIAAQTMLARELPDYWQHFEAVRVRYTEEHAGSGSERRGLLGRLFGRG